MNNGSNRNNPGRRGRGNARGNYSNNPGYSPRNGSAFSNPRARNAVRNLNSEFDGVYPVEYIPENGFVPAYFANGFAPRRPPPIPLYRPGLRPQLNPPVIVNGGQHLELPMEAVNFVQAGPSFVQSSPRRTSPFYQYINGQLVVFNGVIGPQNQPGFNGVNGPQNQPGFSGNLASPSTSRNGANSCTKIEGPRSAPPSPTRELRTMMFGPLYSPNNHERIFLKNVLNVDNVKPDKSDNP